MANPLKWPEIEQLGRDFFDHLSPALNQLVEGEEKVCEKAQRQLDRLTNWLDSPCFVTVKLDGTNVGIDDKGVIAGRNHVVEPGATYQKVDVWKLLAGHSEKVALFKKALESGLKDEPIAQAMLYGELVIQNRYDYTVQGIHNQWLCFGAVLRPHHSDEEAPRRMAALLRAMDINASAKETCVLIAPNQKLFELFAELGITTVAQGYRCPREACSDKEWLEPVGSASLHAFPSLRGFLSSQWMRRFLTPEGGTALGEGVVVASAATGRLFKFKHGGEELGKVPDQLEELLTKLHSLPEEKRASMLCPGLLDAAAALHAVATFKPQGVKAKKEPKEPQEKKDDDEARVAFDSALTKFDALEDVFARGAEAKTKTMKDLVEQVAVDLVKDYGVKAGEAQQRAKKAVARYVGIRFGEWKKNGA